MKYFLVNFNRKNGFENIGIIVFMFLLPWSINLSSIGTLVLVSCFVVSKLIRYKDTSRLLINHKLISGYFLFLFFNSLLQGNGNIRGIETYLPFLLFPLIFIFSFNYFDKNRIYLLKLYVLGVSLASAFCLIKAFIIYFDEFYLFLNGYEPVTNLIGMHPSYLSLYVSFAFFILVSIVSDKWKKQNRYQKILYFVWLFFLFFMIFYIRSRMGVISFILVAFLLLLRTVSLKKAIISIITLLILGFAGFMVIEKTNFNKGRFQLDQVNESLTLKKLQAEASLKVFKENMIFGVSLSNEKKEMLKQYEEINFEKGISNNYNSHNQYLNVLVHSGMVGFALLFFPVFKLFKKNIKLEELSFLLLSFFSFFTESFLERHKGIVWFVFFLCFFINQNNKN